MCTLASACACTSTCVYRRDQPHHTTPHHTTQPGPTHLGADDATADGGGDLLGALVAKANMALLVTDHHVGLEAEALASGCLLGHRLDAHDLVLQSLAAEKVHNLVLRDAHGEKEDILERLNLALL